MAVYTPPTENIPIFDNSAFPSSDGTALTIATGSKYFLTYPVAQGEEIFPSNITLQSSITDSTGSKGLSTQVLTSTGTGTQWAYSGLNGYSTYAMSALPFTLPTTVYSNLYVLFTGTGSGILTIPITGFTTGTLLSIKNISSGSLNIDTSAILYTVSTVTTTLFSIGASRSMALYFNGSYWIQTTLLDKINDLTVSGTLTATNLSFNGALQTSAIIQAATGDPVELYNTTSTSHLYLGGGATIGPQHTTGAIIIGSDSTATGGINIGTGTNLVIPTTNTINIGSATYGTIIKGTLTGDGGFSSSSGNITTAGTGAISTTGTGSISTTSGSISSSGIITGTSVVCGTYGPSSDTSDVSFCGTTTGTINIGTALRTESGKFINIGNGSGSIGQIIIGSNTTTAATTTALQGNINIGTSSTGREINLGTSTSTTKITGLLTSDTNIQYTTNTATTNTTEYLQGGVSVVNMTTSGTFVFGTQRLNKIVNIWVSGTGTKTITLPTTPPIGQMLFLRSGASGGSLSITIASAGQQLYPSNTNTSVGVTSIALPLIGASQWCYIATNRWMQMDASIDPLVDATSGNVALNIGSKVLVGNITIGSALTTGDIELGTSASDTSIKGTASIGGNLSMATEKTIFTTSGQQLRLGYANTQTTGTSTSSFGPFIKSFGPDTATSGTYTILYEGTNGLFSATGIDGCGGLLTIFIKSGGGRFATYTYTVVKRSGITTFTGMQPISLNASGWATNPAVGGSGNNITVSFGGSEWVGATVSWTILGSV